MIKPAPIVQRHLAAIFSADVSGYTRLMNVDEAGTLRLLSSHRDIADRLIAQHGGRIANTAGDSILAEFPSAVNALQCALDIQARITTVNEEVPEARRLRFRIGVHVGEAMLRNGDLFGDAVNVAARMQGLAEPGSVCLSGAASEYARSGLPLALEDLGPQQVKNLDTPIRAYLARPSGEPPSRVLPTVHRRAEAHLARRFHEMCLAAVLEVTSPLDLTQIDFAVLASLHDAPGIDEAWVAERVGIDLTRARQALRRLQTRRLIDRMHPATNPHARGLALTPEGLDSIQRLRPAIRAAMDRVMAPLSDRERETLTELLARVIKTSDVKASPSPSSGTRGSSATGRRSKTS